MTRRVCRGGCSRPGVNAQTDGSALQDLNEAAAPSVDTIRQLVRGQRDPNAPTLAQQVNPRLVRWHRDTRVEQGLTKGCGHLTKMWTSGQYVDICGHQKGRWTTRTCVFGQGCLDILTSMWTTQKMTSMWTTQQMTSAHSLGYQ